MFWNGRTAIDGLSGSGKASRPRPLMRLLDAIGADWLGNVVHLLLAEVDAGERQLAFDLIVDIAADADAARLGKFLQPRGNVDAVTIDRAAICDHVAQIDAHPEFHPLVIGQFGIGDGKRRLDIHGAFHGLDHAGKFDEQAVACRADDAATKARNGRFYAIGAYLLQSGERSGLVGCHEPRVTRDICGQDCDKPARLCGQR